MPTMHGISHIDLSVTDVERSSRWYCGVLGLRRIRRDEFPGRSSVLLKDDRSGLFVGLSAHAGRVAERFDERGPGLDHLGFAVADRAELDAWERHLDRLGVIHSAVAEDPAGVGCALVFRDPDNIQLEMWWTRPPAERHAPPSLGSAADARPADVRPAAGGSA